MTREEAIHFATCLKSNWTINFADMEEFCDMAIEALKAKTDGDLVRRSDAIEAVENNSYGMGSRASVKAIKALPSAEAVQGEWTNVGVLTVRCSNCKSEFHELEAMNFCPNCGADMRGEDGEA